MSALFLRRVHVPLDDIPRRHGKIERCRLHVETAALRTRDGQQVVHESVHPIDLTLDRREIPVQRLQVELGALLARSAHPRAHQLCERLERRERRAQLVRDNREELLSLAFGGVDVCNVVHRHHSSDDSSIIAVDRSGVDGEIASLPRALLCDEELAGARLTA